MSTLLTLITCGTRLTQHLGLPRGAQAHHMLHLFKEICLWDQGEFRLLEARLGQPAGGLQEGPGGHFIDVFHHVADGGPESGHCDLISPRWGEAQAPFRGLLIVTSLFGAFLPLAFAQGLHFEMDFVDLEREMLKAVRAHVPQVFLHLHGLQHVVLDEAWGCLGVVRPTTQGTNELGRLNGSSAPSRKEKLLRREARIVRIDHFEQQLQIVFLKAPDGMLLTLLARSRRASSMSMTRRRL